MIYRIGHGYDVHQTQADRRLILGGVEIESNFGLLGHSDADVVIHALIDAILGALGKGDIGTWFPNTDPDYKDANSLELLAVVWKQVSAEGWKVENCDLTILAERPKLSPYLNQMRLKISHLLNVEPEQVGLKATTNEKLGFVGREEGIAAWAVVLLSSVR